MQVDWEKFWEKVELQRDTAQILKEFVETTGKTTFTYQDVRIWYYGTSAHLHHNKDWHTIERLMRKLAELGYLLRYKYKRTVRFVLVPYDEVTQAIDSYRAQYQQALALGDARKIAQLVKGLSFELDIPEDDAREILMGQEVLDKWV